MDTDSQLATSLLTESLKSRVSDTETEIVFEDALEPLAVHVLVQQILLLGHYSSSIRITSAVYITQFAEIVSEKIVSQVELSRILNMLLNTEQGLSASISNLFRLIGSSFQIMVLPLIAGLELFSTHSDGRTRAVTNTCIAQLVFENQSEVLKEDKFTTPYTLFPDRIVIIKALQLLCPLFRVEDQELSGNIVATFIKLSNKTPQEIECMKQTITLIFEASLGKQNTELHKKPSDLYFPIFIDLISCQDESIFDMLEWSMEQFFITESKRTKGKSFKSSFSQLSGDSKGDEQPLDTLQEFSYLLSNHFRAPHPLIRYGSSLSLFCICKLCPSFLGMNAHIWPFLFSGLLDSDHMTAAMYLSILPLLKLPDNGSVKAFLETHSRLGHSEITYDEIYVNQQIPDDSVLNTSALLDILVQYAPPIQVTMLHKIANSLEFLPLKQKLIQLELLRVWAKKCNKSDLYLMKMLVPLCSRSDERVQLSSIKVVTSLLPSFEQASQSDVAFLWKYMSALLDIHFDQSVILAAIQLLLAFPIGQLSVIAKEEVISKLFALVFHKKAIVRYHVYEYFLKTSGVWSSNGLLFNILGLLFLSLGDSNAENVKKLVGIITSIGSSFIGPIGLPLSKLKDNNNCDPLSLMKLYDQLATSLAIVKLEMKLLVECINMPSRIDSFWNYFLQGVPENQLARPEEYDFGRNYIHNPVFIALLCCKLSISPPPIGADHGARDQIPSTPMGKRRFYCGLMQCLFPSCGSWNPMIRHTACISMIFCCFKGFNIYSDMLKSVLEYISQLFVTSKYITYQISALDIFAAIVRIKVPGVSEAIFNQYYDLCIEFLHNTHSPMITSAVLKLLEIFLMVFPKAMSKKLQEVRDITRGLLVHADREVCDQAAKVYPLIFKAVQAEEAIIFVDYLVNDINLLQNTDSPQAMADPLVSRLNMNQLEQVLAINILSIGLITKSDQGVFSTAQFLMDFLSHPNPSFRGNALVSILNLVSSMNTLDASTTLWILLPLYADMNYQIRMVWSRFRRNVPSQIQLRCTAVLAHVDDSIVLPLQTWDDVLSDQSSILVNAKGLSDLTFEIDQLSHIPLNELPIEDDGYHLPTMSEKLMLRIRGLVQTLTNSLTVPAQNLVKHHFQQLMAFPPIAPIMMLVLSEFGCMHDDSFEDTAQVLLANLTFGINASEWPLIEASIIGIGNIIINSRSMLKRTVDELTIHSGMSEGELTALVYLFEKLGNLSNNVILEICQKCQTIISGSRHSKEKRLLASCLAADCALQLDTEQKKLTLDSIQNFMESLQHPKIRESVFQIAGRLLVDGGDKHALFRSMSLQSKKFLLSKEPEVREQALFIFRIISKSMPKDDFMQYAFTLLADSDPIIRENTKNILLQENLVDFAMDSLIKIQPVIDNRGELIRACRLPCMDTVGIQINDRNAVEQITNEYGTFVDHFNIQYYCSERRKRFSKLFGINETVFIRAMDSLTLGVRKKVEVNLVGISNEEQGLYNAENKLHSLQPLQLLMALIPYSPKGSRDLVETLIGYLKVTIGIKSTTAVEEEECKDIELMVHRIDILTNLIIAHGKNEVTNLWIEQIQDFILACSSKSAKLRESLYCEMENSFYYHSQYADIPIISEDQIVALQELRDLSQESILEVVKSGKTEKIALIDSKNDQWNGSMDSNSDTLRRWTILSTHVLAGFGLYYTITTNLPDETLASAFSFLINMLDEEHRGFRLVVIDCCTYMVNSLSNFKSHAVLYEHVNQIVVELLEKVNTQDQTLYRKKADLISLISQILPHYSDKELQRTVLKCLLRMWRDPDSEVRHVSINMVQHLGELGVEEVLAAFHDHEYGFSVVDSPIDIMKELVQLTNKDDFLDKDKLRNLLKWRFSQAHKKSRPVTTNSKANIV